MAGGAGTRFWPVSTEERPKQFIPFLGKSSLLQLSYQRLSGLVAPEQILVLTAARYQKLVQEQLPELPVANIIGEPCRRDTAAAVCLGALACRRLVGNQGVMLVLTADHWIAPVSEFQEALLAAAAACADGSLYTFGIRPSYPATSYGYLKIGEAHKRGTLTHHRVEAFREKPDRETAQQYLESQNFLWNSGMFVWRVADILKEFEQHLPAHIERLGPALELWGQDAFPAALETALQPLDKVSIDYGVMEKANSVATVIGEFDWSDVGGWAAIPAFMQQDTEGNAFRGLLHTMAAGNNLVFCEDPDETVALIGVSDLVVVRSQNRTLVMNREEGESLKRLVTLMQRRDKGELSLGSETSTTVHG